MRATDQQKVKHFVRAGEIHQKAAAAAGKTPPLTLGKARQMRVDLGRQLVFPPEVRESSLRPDCVMWSTAARKINELTVL